MKILLIPSPPPEGRIENGQDRYLDALVRGVAGRVQLIGLDDPQYARGPEKKWDGRRARIEAQPRFRVVRLIPRSIRSLMGYCREAWRLSRLLRPYRNQVDLIHVNRVGCEVQSIAAKLAGFKRVVTTIHNLPGDAEKGNWVCRLVEWLSFKCGDVHIAVSEATFEAWRDRVGLRKKEGDFEQKETKETKAGVMISAGMSAGAPAKSRTQEEGGEKNSSLLTSFPSVQTYSSSDRGGKCVVIYNGMDPEDLTGFDRRAYRGQFCEDPDHTFIIGICARLHRMKGHVVLLEAFAKLLKEFEQKSQRTQSEENCIPAGGGKDNSSFASFATSVQTPDFSSCLLLIAGSGPEEALIKAKIAELGIGDYVRLLGRRNDAERFAASLDLNVLPSVSLECLPYSLVEAMFHGVPSVVSDVGGMKDLIRDSGGGRVVPAGDVWALVEAMTTLVKDSALREQAGRDAQEYARRELTAGKMAGLTLGVYREVWGA